MTEEGDPQFYVLGAEPEQRCVASVSRVRRRYILEDGDGRVLAEHATLAHLVQDANGLFRSRGRVQATVRVSLALYAVRSLVEEKFAAVEDALGLIAVLV
jgi:hypothetical protein